MKTSPRFTALLGVVFLCLATGLHAGDEYGPTPLEPLTGGAGIGKIRITDSRFDWGDVYQGEQVEGSFVIENIGDGPLRILDVKPGCSCSMADQDYARELAPGGSTTVRIKVNTDRMKKKEKYSKSAKITTNDPKQPTTTVFLSGKVQKVLDWEPRRVSFNGLVGADAHGEAQIFVPDERVKVELVSVESHGSRIELEGVEEMESGRRWLVRMRAEAEEKSRSVRDSVDVTVRVDDKRTVLIPMPVTAKFSELIQITPRNTLTFNKSDTKRLLDGGPITKDVKIRSADPKVAFRITGVELVDVPDGLFEANVAEVKPGAEYQVQVTLNHYVARRYVRGKVRISTDHPNFPTKDLRIYARFEDRQPVEKGE